MRPHHPRFDPLARTRGSGRDGANAGYSRWLLVALVEVATRAGHASVRSILDRYGHLDLTLRERLDAIWFGQRRQTLSVRRPGGSGASARPHGRGDSGR
jgi:hypothetical protein